MRKGSKATISAIVAGAIVLTFSTVSFAAPKQIDWYTYGGDLHRTGENTAETTIGTNNVASLHELWSAHLGGVILGQPVVASNVTIGTKSHTVIYVGDESGHFAAIDQKNGAILWQRNFPTAKIQGCGEVTGGVYGIGDTALIDRFANTVFITAGDGAVHALDLSTGTEQAGWPVQVFDPTQLTSYGGITSDRGFNALYIQMASHCDITPYHGGLAKVDVGQAKVTATFHPSGSFSGGGIWGVGGASYDPGTNHLFVATGNAFTNPESYGYSNQVVELDANLNVVGANYPGVTGVDVDFGSTPLIYQAPGCPLQVAAENKTGIVVTYNAGHLGDGPVQRLQIANKNSPVFDGMAAYSSSLHTLFVSVTSDTKKYQRGMLALKVNNKCKLVKLWNTAAGPNATPMASPMIANGVVYFADGYGGTVHAFNAATGAQLWSKVLDDSAYSTPTVVNGQLLVGTWSGTLHAFGS